MKEPNQNLQNKLNNDGCISRNRIGRLCPLRGRRNCSLKELCQLAEINDPIRITTYKGNVRTDTVHPKWELVGTHTGRRTFIVQALSMGISPNIVMKWTGHSDYKAMKPYIDIVDSIKAQSMTKFNNLL